MGSELERLRQKCAELESKLDQSEKSRRESEEWFRKIFHASSNMMAIHTIKEGRFVDVNEAAASLGGFKREELIGYTMPERNLIDDPALRELIDRKLREEGRLRNMELKMRGKNGETRTVLASLDPITVNNEPCILAVSISPSAQPRNSCISAAGSSVGPTAWCQPSMSTSMDAGYALQTCWRSSVTARSTDVAKSMRQNRAACSEISFW